ncbi:NAD(P)H-binding protein [Pedobacter soli]|uniref:Uncharacterized conserved protein YbjT, contains NAD(P)-binding and DUF2867 domains n=1 Tax=Pedobacter soli TaxID=390242 RepID=A0A1G6ZJI3_9SPHI|nr:NAD(P)H-binding protein [Pedobacter soli]SDE01706.1 Uncharacterized conserved protein YbjT, contains NAD(P)-binding and DUF2867 domains [Pedobacter soli]
MKSNFVILGGTGHIGSALAEQLLKQEKSVLIIGHNEEKAEVWRSRGAGFETADVLDSEKLHELFGLADRLFILNPPAYPGKDAEAQERKQVQSILSALAGLKPEQIVMASTYGARDEEGIFDLGTLYALERGLKAHESPLAIIRSAYYMSNLDMPAEMAIESGKFDTLLPADFKLPMVSPVDIGHFAAQVINEMRTGTFYIQAAGEYSAADAVGILNDILDKNIRANEIPKKDWAAYLQKAGFSAASIRSFTGMTELTINEKFKAPDPYFGKTTLEHYLSGLVQKSSVKRS